MKRGSAAWVLGCGVLLAAPGSALARGQSAGSGEDAGSSALVKPTPSSTSAVVRGSKPPSVPKSKAGVPNKPPAQTDAQSAPRFVWPSLRVLEQVDASEVVEAGGVPVVLRAVVVKDSVQDLVQRFADAFRAGGLHVPPGNEQPQLASGAAMLTAVDMYRGLTFTVILQPQEGGVTLVYLGEANHTLRREPSAEGDVATLPPGAHQVLRVNDEGSRTMSFLVPMSASEVDTFYAQVLGRDGWRRADGDASSYTRANEELRVVHELAEGGLRSVVLILRGRARAAQGSPVP
ncbi:hypothetical protein NVS55_03775 [Myxococcus stipitatus]|uniref:hypothetical protein n=1 Tax=Myxococcus stipitatus TaxID=83455 RepID=UPI003144DA09